MDSFFWKSTQKARREHFCDWCCNPIEPGMIYRREIWVPHRGCFHVMNQHQTPGCPPNLGDEFAREAMQEERATLGEPIILEIRLKEVVIIQRNGSTIVEQETEMVPIVGYRAPSIREYADDEDIPF